MCEIEFVISRCFPQIFVFENINIRNHGKMIVTNRERVREFRGELLHVRGGGVFSAVNLHVHVKNLTVDALAALEVTVRGQNFVHKGTFRKVH